jgi:hypothetical protein
MSRAQMIAATVLTVASGLAMHMTQAQQAGTKRTDLQRHDPGIALTDPVGFGLLVSEARPGTRCGADNLDAEKCRERQRFFR